MNLEVSRLLEANEPLRCAGNALSDLIEESPYMAHLKDAQTGKYILSNLQWAESIGFDSAQSTLGLTVMDVFSREKAYGDVALSDWKDKEPEEIKRFDDEVQVSEHRIRKQRFSFTAEGCILLRDTVKAPVFNQNKQKIVAILTQSQNVTLRNNLFELFKSYRKYYSEKEAIQKMLITLDVDGYFNDVPNAEEMETLIALCYERSDKENNIYIQNLLNKVKKGYWYEMLTRFRIIPINMH